MMNWALPFTVGVSAIQTSVGLVRCLNLIIFTINFYKTNFSLLGSLLFRIISSYLKKLKVILKFFLGDLLLQTVYHTAIGEEEGLFTFHSVADAISDKMVARHPHVFGDQSRDKTAAQQTIDWETIKAAERAQADQTRALDGVALGLPALTRAVKLQKRAARVGFDWPDVEQVLDKLREEIDELKEAKSAAHRHEEFGDLMFVMANLARHMGLDPEQALRDANGKFTRRFNSVEAKLQQDGRTPSQSNLAEMDALWDEVKREETISE